MPFSIDVNAEAAQLNNVLCSVIVTWTDTDGFLGPDTMVPKFDCCINTPSGVIFCLSTSP